MVTRDRLRDRLDEPPLLTFSVGIFSRGRASGFAKVDDRMMAYTAEPKGPAASVMCGVQQSLLHARSLPCHLNSPLTGAKTIPRLGNRR